MLIKCEPFCLWCGSGKPNNLKTDIVIESSTRKTLEKNILFERTDKVEEYKVTFYNYGNSIIMDQTKLTQ